MIQTQIIKTCGNVKCKPHDVANENIVFGFVYPISCI